MGNYNNLNNTSLSTLRTYEISLLAEIANGDHSKRIRDAARINLEKVRKEMIRRYGN